MKTRMSLIFSTLVVILVSMIWVVRDRGSNGDVAVAPAITPPPMFIVSPVPAAVPVETAAPATQPAVVATAAAADAVAPTDARMLVHIDADGKANYTAREGDTVSELAIALLGSDSKANRDAVIAANTSLQKNPDRVLEGYTYSIVPVTAQATASAAAPENADVTDAKADAVTPDAVTPDAATPDAATPDAATVSDAAAAPARKLKYTAQPGDSVAVLAASLLGGDTKANRDAVIQGNASLQRDPDHLVAGQTYTIATSGALAAGSDARPVLSPSTQPDADEAARASVGRVLRYTAQPGDTVSKLATVLLGSDTKANRQAIIDNNQSLKQDPDHLVAGKSYWIAAPTPSPVADTTTP